MGERVSNSASVSQGRIHGLDAFRGILMMLGIVLHSSHGDWFRYGSEGTQLFIHTNSHVIHLFRMPAFFLLSGFFVPCSGTKEGHVKPFVIALTGLLFLCLGGYGLPFRPFVFWHASPYSDSVMYRTLGAKLGCPRRRGVSSRQSAPPLVLILPHPRYDHRDNDCGLAGAGRN